MIYRIGQKVPEFIGHEEAPLFDFSDEGAVMMVFFNNPTAAEVEQFQSGRYFEVRFTDFSHVIMIAAKIGNLNWMDMPYTPHLSSGLTRFHLPGKGEGLSLVLMLIDGVSGEVKAIRLLGLSEHFTRRFIGAVMEESMEPFDKITYNQKVLQIQNRYTTKEIVGMSKDYCRINS